METPDDSSTEKVLTYKEREQVSYAARPQKCEFFKPKSRKKRYMSRRAPVKDLKRTYRCGVMRASNLGDYKLFCGEDCYTGPLTTRSAKTPSESDSDRTHDASDLIDLTLEDGDESELSTKGQNVSRDKGAPLQETQSENTTLGHSCIEDDTQIWPTHAQLIDHTENPAGIVVPDIGSLDWCGCKDFCDPDRCPNAVTSIFCARNNCRNGKFCGNRLRNLGGLRLAKGELGYCAYTTTFIHAGTIVGEYAGVLSTHNYADNKTYITVETANYKLNFKTPNLQKSVA